VSAGSFIASLVSSLASPAVVVTILVIFHQQFATMLGGSLSEAQLAAADFDQLMEAALRAGLLDAATVRSLDGLRHLRNLARANPSLTQRQAQEFAVLADAVSYGMRRDSGSVWPAA
jgi:hypothetical protein